MGLELGLGLGLGVRLGFGQRAGREGVRAWGRGGVGAWGPRLCYVGSTYYGATRRSRACLTLALALTRRHVLGLRIQCCRACLTLTLALTRRHVLGLLRTQLLPSLPNPNPSPHQAIRTRAAAHPVVAELAVLVQQRGEVARVTVTLHLLANDCGG